MSKIREMTIYYRTAGIGIWGGEGVGGGGVGGGGHSSGHGIVSAFDMLFSIKRLFVFFFLISTLVEFATVSLIYSLLISLTVHY